MPTRKTVIAGSSFHRGAGDILARLRGNERMQVRRAPPDDKIRMRYDDNAIEIRMFGRTLGYLPRGVAAEFAPRMDAGLELHAFKLPIEGAAICLSWDEPEQE